MLHIVQDVAYMLPVIILCWYRNVRILQGKQLTRYYLLASYKDMQTGEYIIQFTFPNDCCIFLQSTERIKHWLRNTNWGSSIARQTSILDSLDSHPSVVNRQSLPINQGPFVDLSPVADNQLSIFCQWLTINCQSFHSGWQWSVFCKWLTINCRPLVYDYYLIAPRRSTNKRLSKALHTQHGITTPV